MAHLNMRAYAAISGTIFFIVALVHAIRLYEHWNLVIGDWQVSMWGSVAGLIVAGYLAFEAFHFVWPMGFGTHARLPGS